MYLCSSLYSNYEKSFNQLFRKFRFFVVWFGYWGSDLDWLSMLVGGVLSVFLTVLPSLTEEQDEVEAFSTGLEYLNFIYKNCVEYPNKFRTFI